MVTMLCHIRAIVLTVYNYIIGLVLQMISAEAPVLFAKAAEIFINELSLRAWIHTEDNKRRTLQVGSIDSHHFPNR